MMEIPAKKIFRGVLIATVLSSLLEFGFYFLQRDNLPAELKKFIILHSAQVLAHQRVLFLSVAIAQISFFTVSVIGLYLLWSPARIIFILFIATSLLSSLLFGPAIEPEGMAFWDGVSEILNGVI
ncbi:MAG: hypothetical protein ACREE6_13175, partial [Limisphaerales bacterium]